MVIDTRVFAVINTTDYNMDNICSIYCARGVEECMNFGWDYNELHRLYGTDDTNILIGEMRVGDIIMSLDYNGAYLMRIA
jgi:hypothetical protein